MNSHAQKMPNVMRKPRRESTVDQAIEDRINGLAEWLDENAPDASLEQAHLDEGSSERAYWHHGYLAALRDLQALLRGQRASLN
jgi:hypothetical protein